MSLLPDYTSEFDKSMELVGQSPIDEIVPWLQYGERLSAAQAGTGNCLFKLQKALNELLLEELTPTAANNQRKVMIVKQQIALGKQVEKELGRRIKWAITKVSAEKELAKLGGVISQNNA